LYLQLRAIWGNAKLVAGAEPGPPAQGETLIRNATILTASHGTINNGSILIRDGKIAEIGANVKARDPNARVIDATGKYVTPGIIDCHSHTGVEGSVNEGSLSVTSMVRVRDVIDPYSPSIYRELAGGTTTANVLHGSANSIGGQNAVIKFKIGKPVDDWFVPGAPPGIKFALGENPKRSNSQGGRRRRHAVIRRLAGRRTNYSQAFIKAKDYMRSGGVRCKEGY
jgi:imidazolonepropionase-like amidohydrolase